MNVNVKLYFNFFFSIFSRVVRKSIARVLTVINQTQKENLRKFYKVSLMPLKHTFMHTCAKMLFHYWKCLKHLFRWSGLKRIWLYCRSKYDLDPNIKSFRQIHDRKFEVVL